MRRIITPISVILFASIIVAMLIIFSLMQRKEEYSIIYNIYPIEEVVKDQETLRLDNTITTPSRLNIDEEFHKDIKIINRTTA